MRKLCSKVAYSSLLSENHQQSSVKVACPGLWGLWAPPATVGQAATRALLCAPQGTALGSYRWHAHSQTGEGAKADSPPDEPPGSASCLLALRRPRGLRAVLAPALLPHSRLTRHIAAPCSCLLQFIVVQKK